MNSMSISEIIAQIKNEVNNLPGEDAHRDMLPFRLTAKEAFKKPIEYRLSAVLILLYEDAGTLKLILTERPDYDGTHSGQISLPGGKIEDSDKSTRETALRETEEELGIDARKIEIVGQLTEVFIPVSQFLIHPYIGFIDGLPELNPDSWEVKSVIHCSVHQLLNDQNRILKDFKVKTGHIKDIPAFDFDGNFVWGATAIILNEFKFIMQRI